MQTKNIVWIVVALVVGIGIGFGIKSSSVKSSDQGAASLSSKTAQNVFNQSGVSQIKVTSAQIQQMQNVPAQSWSLVPVEQINQAVQSYTKSKTLVNGVPGSSNRQMACDVYYGSTYLGSTNWNMGGGTVISTGSTGTLYSYNLGGGFSALCVSVL